MSRLADLRRTGSRWLLHPLQQGVAQENRQSHRMDSGGRPQFQHRPAGNRQPSAGTIYSEAHI